MSGAFDPHGWGDFWERQMTSLPLGSALSLVTSEMKQDLGPSQPLPFLFQSVLVCTGPGLGCLDEGPPSPLLSEQQRVDVGAASLQAAGSGDTRQDRPKAACKCCPPCCPSPLCSVWAHGGRANLPQHMTRARWAALHRPGAPSLSL